MRAPSAAFAHQGGWDEILMFALPIVIAVGAIRWVERQNRTPGDDPANEAPDHQTHPS